MSETETKRARINDKIAKSQARLKRDAKPVAPPRKSVSDRAPPEDMRSLAAEYPWLTVAGGLAAGLVLGALLPRAAGSKLGRRAVGLASVAAELGMAYSRQARDAASDAAHSGAAKLGELGHQLEENTAELRGRARRQAGAAASSTRSTGKRVIREALRLASRVRQ